MNTVSTDTELLRRYVEDRSEAAFAELVRLHLNLVYFAALRQLGGDVHRAKDVAQTVFTDLARKAASLTGRATLTGWLHTSTRFAAAKARRADLSRQQHEQEATTMNALLSEPDPAVEWERLRPLIDDAIHELDDRDREAVLLRFFEGRPFAEIGVTLRLSEDAARMRVDRALDKLRTALARRGVKSTSTALATIFANQIGAAAPAGLATSIAATAFAGAVGGMAEVETVFIMSKTSTAIISAVALAAIGLTFLQWTRAQRAETELASLALDRDSLRIQLRAEQQRTARLAQDFTAQRREVEMLQAKPDAVAAAPVSALPPAQVVVQQQKAILKNLIMIEAAADQFGQVNGRLPASLDEIVGPGKYIKSLKQVDGEDYSSVSLIPWLPHVVTTAGGMAVVRDGNSPNSTRPEPSPALLHAVELGRRVEPAYKKALEAYQATHGRIVPNNEALLPLFATPQEGADFVELIEAQKAARGK